MTYEEIIKKYNINDYVLVKSYGKLKLMKIHNIENSMFIFKNLSDKTLYSDNYLAFQKGSIIKAPKILVKFFGSKYYI